MPPCYDHLPVSSSLIMSSRRLVPPVVAMTLTPPMCLLTWMQIWLTWRASSLVGTMTTAAKHTNVRDHKATWLTKSTQQDGHCSSVSLYLVCCLSSGRCVQVREWGRRHFFLCRSWLWLECPFQTTRWECSPPAGTNRWIRLDSDFCLANIFIHAEMHSGHYLYRWRFLPAHFKDAHEQLSFQAVILKLVSLGGRHIL